MKKNFNLSKAIIPNSFTALNALCGYISITLSANEKYELAFFFIIFASLFDLFDGILARLVKTSSEFGVQLDSLSDIISFGVAPAFLIYRTSLFNFEWIGMLISGVFVVFGAFRLARFNVQVTDFSVKTDFKGLPIPIAALTLSSFVWNFYRDGAIISPHKEFVIPLIIILALLMVSTVKYNALPKLSFDSLKQKPLFIGFVVVSIAMLIISKGEFLFYVFFVLVLFGIFRKVFEWISNSSNDDSIAEETN
jgi:CDP-diacylglycerol--serine O-phosphatidyltransferase